MFTQPKQTCPSCGAPVQPNSNFCPACGSPMGSPRCSKGHENPPGSRFCGTCGEPIRASEAPKVKEYSWARGENNFAVKITTSDLPGLLRRGLIVEPGTNALMIEHGRMIGRVAPGRYTLEKVEKKAWDWLTTGVPTQATFLLVDATPTDLEFHAGGIPTSDDLPVGASLLLSVGVGDPGVFLLNVLKGRDQLTREDLRQYLNPEVSDVVEQWLRRHTLKQLAEDYTLRSQLETEVEQALKRICAQSGLDFYQVRALRLNLEPYDRIRNTRGQFAIWQEEDRLKLEIEKAKAASDDERRRFDEQIKYAREREALETKRRYAQLEAEGKLDALAEEERKVGYEEKQLLLQDRIRQAVISDKMKEVNTREQFDQFMDEIDTKRALRARAREEMRRIWREEADDRDKARAHLLARLEVERSYDLRMMEVKLQHGVNVETVKNEQEIAEMRTDFEYRQRRRVAEEALKNEEERMRIQRERDRLEAERQQAQLAMQKAIHDQERAEENQDVADAMSYLKMMRDMRFEEERRKLELERLDLAERKRIEREDELEKETRRLKLELERWEAQERSKQAERKFQLDLRDKDQAAQESRQNFEINKLEKLALLSAEALASISTQEQGMVLVELKKAEALKGMTDEQILAMAAASSPEVAKAFQERYRAAAESQGKAGQELRDWMDRMLKESQAARQQQVDLLSRELDRQQADHRDERAAAERMNRAGLDTSAQIARDVSQAGSRGGGQPIIITPSGDGGARVINPAEPRPGEGGAPMKQGSATKVCLECGQHVPVEDAFCPNCGHAFKGVR